MEELKAIHLVLALIILVLGFLGTYFGGKSAVSGLKEVFEEALQGLRSSLASLEKKSDENNQDVRRWLRSLQDKADSMDREIYAMQRVREDREKRGGE